MQSEVAMRPNIFETTDLRTFLESTVFYLKVTYKDSLRDICKRAGLKNPNYLKLLAAGERRLSEGRALALGKALRLTEREMDYFLSLLQFHQEIDREKKDRCLEKLLKIQRKHAPKLLRSEQFDFFSTWYMPTVFEACAFLELPKDTKLLAKELEISELEVRTALDILNKLGMIEMGESGWEKSSSQVETTPEVLHSSIRRFHQDMLKVMERKVNELPADKRNLQGVTLTLTPPQYEKLKADLTELMKKTLGKQRVDKSGSPSVYHLEICLVPLFENRKK